MQVVIRSTVISANVHDALRQMEQTYGARLANLAAEASAFSSFGKLCISPYCPHPLYRAAAKSRRSFDAPTNTYFASPLIDYVRFASPDWRTRVSAYSEAVELAIASVFKTRLTPAEREHLLDMARRACADISEAPPPQIAEVTPVYVRAGDGDGPTLTFSPYPGMIPVTLEDIPNHQPVWTPKEERLFKLYVRTESGARYREAWFADDTTITEHSGNCGDRGETLSHSHAVNKDARRTFERLKREARAEGYRAIPLSKHAKLVVELRVQGFGTQADLDRRHALEEFLDDLVGWLGLGHLDGGSIGSGTIEAMCYVVDFSIAKTAVEKALSNSPFADFSRVYRER